MPKATIVIILFTSLFSLIVFRAEAIDFLIEDSPYYVQKDLVIEEGETFTVEPGVVIEMAKDTGIVIEGRINISGYPKTGGVIFKAKGPHQNYHKGFWKGIIIKSKEKNSINYAIIQHSKTAVEIKPNGFVNITNNIITQNKIGIKAKAVGDLLTIRNTFLGNFTDISLIESAGVVDRNFFQGSLISVKIEESYPKVEGNYFKKAYQKTIECDNKKDFHIAENWWGSANVEKIQDLVSQKGKGRVNFQPFLKEAPDLKKVGVDLKDW